MATTSTKKVRIGLSLDPESLKQVERLCVEYKIPTKSNFVEILANLIERGYCHDVLKEIMRRK